jgi:hypothetical protein
MLFRRDLQEVKYMSPEELHIWQIDDYAMFYRIGEFQGTLVLVYCLSNVNILAICRDHDFLVLWSTHAIILLLFERGLL